MFFGRSAAGADRASQIGLLTRENPVVRKVDGGGVEAYDAGLQLSTTGQIIRLRIMLPPSFPRTAPVLQILEPADHAWLDGHGRVVGHPGLARWNPSMNLGRIVKETLGEFSTRPPVMRRAGGPAPGPGPRGYPRGPAPRGYGPGPAGHGPRGPMARGPPAPGGWAGPSAYPGTVGPRGAPAGSMPPGPRGYPGPGPRGPDPRRGSGSGVGMPATRPAMTSPPSYTSATARGPAGAGPRGPTTGSGAGAGRGEEHMMMPPVPDSFPALQSKSAAELQLLNKDTESLQHFVFGLPEVQGFSALLESTRQENLEQARKNAAQEETFRALKAEIDGLRTDIDARKKQLSETAMRQRALLDRFSTDVMIRKLEAKARSIESSSDSLSQDFIDSTGGDAKTFVKDFVAARTAYHMCAAKAELLRKNGAA